MKQILIVVCILVSVGCRHIRYAGRPPVLVEFRTGEEESRPGLVAVKVAGTGRQVYVNKMVVLSNHDIADAELLREEGETQICFIFTELGSRKLEMVTEANVEKLLAVFVDGRLVCAPTITEPIIEGEAIIGGVITEKEARRIVAGVFKARTKKVTE